MDLELSTDSNKNINQLMIKVNYVNNLQLRNYKNEVENIRKRFLKMQENYITRKSQDVLFIEGIDDHNTNKSQKQKLIDNEQLAWGQHENLEHMKRKTIEMENVSVDIMRNLDNQNNKMKLVGNKLMGVNENIQESESLVKRMLRREYRNKLIVIVFGITLAVALFTYFYFFKINKNK